MTPEILNAILRHALTAIGGTLIANGYATDSQITDAVGALLTLIGITWSICHKRALAKSTIPTTPVCFLLFAFCFLLSACTHAPSGQVSVTGSNTGDITGQVDIDASTNITVGVEVTGNPETGAISGGIVITFNRQPSNETIALLTSAGASPAQDPKSDPTPVLWRLNFWDYTDPDQSLALAAALKEGATITRM